MRTLKFRAWDKKRTGAFNELIKQIGSIYEYFQELQNFRAEYGCEFVLMQYTGLKDKNGVEVFEGDIVDIHGQFGEPDKKFRHVVQWNDEDLCFDMLVGKKVCCGFPTKYPIEVLGNIYQNKELLK